MNVLPRERPFHVNTGGLRPAEQYQRGIVD